MEEIQKRVAAGEISVAAQLEQIRKINAIRAGNFDGPEWKIEPDQPVSGAPQPFPVSTTDATKPNV